MLIFLGLSILGIAALGYRYVATKRRRADLLSTPLTAAQRTMVCNGVPLYNTLPQDLRSPLEGKVNLFLNQVEFIGCDGVEITEDMRLSIAVQACLLIVNRELWYTNLRTLLIYPGAFKSHQPRRNGFVVTERETIRAGESWTRGPVVLSWAHSKQGALNTTDGHNVILHEFAHQMDDLTGGTNGVPILAKGQSFAQWEGAILPAYEAHLRDVERGRKTVMDAYGAQGHEEFFAVGVETFFEKPKAMKQDMPEVYAQFKQLFQLDPLDWA